MDAAAKEQREQAALQELRHEFGNGEKDLGTVYIQQGKTPLVEHVHVLGLPLLGRTHASIGSGLIHVAAVLGLRLPGSGSHDGGGAGELVAGGAPAEAYRCCQIVEQVLKSCNASWGNLVKLTVHVPGLTAGKLETIERVIDQFYGEKDCPVITKTAVGCASLRFGASVQMEGVALIPSAELAREMPAPPGLERMVDSPPVACSPDPQLQLSETLTELEGGSGGQQGAWVVVDEHAVEPICTAEPAQEPAPEAQEEVRCLGLVGQVCAVSIKELPQHEVQRRRLHFQPHHDCCCEVEMLMSKVYRTLRLDPRVVGCQRLPQQVTSTGILPWVAIWSYTFDVAVVRTSNCFMNVGLVEWITEAAAPDLDEMGPAPTLAQLVGASSSSGSTGPEPWQHIAESPRQIMVGCRKGVKWFGEGYWEGLFKDDICEGSLLQFYVDFCMDDCGMILRMRLWLLPSSIIFRKRGWQCVRLARPLCEWAPPPAARKGESYTRSLWVPAVTLFSQEDAAVISWQRGFDGRP